MISNVPLSFPCHNYYSHTMQSKVYVAQKMSSYIIDIALQDEFLLAHCPIETVTWLD